MVQNKILTIIIPTYNMEKYLRKCLDSLIVSDENMQRLEVLVVNDGSKDSSSQIAHEYEAKYPLTFRVIDKENGNYGSCINRGLKEATGKYVKVLDADDYVVSDNFSVFLTLLMYRNEELIISDTLNVNEKGEPYEKTEFHIPMGVPFLINNLCVNDVIHMHSMSYKLDVLRKMNYIQTEGISYTDNEWSTVPLMYVQTCYYFNDSIYCYRHGREGQTVSNESYIKNRVQFLIVVDSVLSKIKFLDEVNPAYPYLVNRVRFILLVIYRKILIDDECRNGIELADFDRKLKTVYPFYYKLLENEKMGKYLRYNYVLDWRNSNYSSVNSFFLLAHKFSAIIRILKSKI